jgi:hypothetical protein
VPRLATPEQAGHLIHRGELGNRASDRADTGSFVIEKTIITSSLEF